MDKYYSWGCLYIATHDLHTFSSPPRGVIEFKQLENEKQTMQWDNRKGGLEGLSVLEETTSSHFLFLIFENFFA